MAWLSRFRYIQPLTSPDVENGGRTVVFTAESSKVAGSPGGPGGAAEMAGGGGTTVAFSCSSKRTRSVTSIPEFDRAAPAPGHAPRVIPSRQIFSDVLNAPVPPLM